MDTKMKDGGPDNYPWMHIYGQYSEHGPAVVRGNKPAMIALRDAIDHAIKDGVGKATNIFAADGEGYSIEIQCITTISSLGIPQYIWKLEFELGKRAAEYERKVQKINTTMLAARSGDK